MVVFSQVLANEVESQLQTLISNTLPASASVVRVDGVYSYHKAVHEGVHSLQEEDSLVFIADVNLRFGPGFFRRCRLNSEMGKRVYYPVAFQLYDLNFKAYSHNSLPPLSPEKGRWDPQYFNHLCIYKRDFVIVGGYGDRQHSLQLFKAITRSHLDTMQAPEPGLFRTWTTKRCRDLQQNNMKTCLDLKRARLFDQSERADYLGELKNIRNSIL